VLAGAIAFVSTLVGLVVLAWAILFITKGRFLKPYFERYAAGSAERQVRVAGDFQFYFNPIDIKFLAEGITVSNPKWATRDQLFRAKTIDMGVRTIPLIFGERRIKRLNLVDGALDLEWDAQGKRNTWTLGDPTARARRSRCPSSSAPMSPAPTLRYRDPQLFLLTDVAFRTFRAADTRFDNEVRFDGTGTLRNRPLR
jgi:uncharacterized protein involved in outer membrane biogenesis